MFIIKIYIINVNISNKFNFWKVHGIMNTSGLLQSIHDSMNLQKSNSFLKCICIQAFFALLLYL